MLTKVLQPLVAIASVVVLNSPTRTWASERFDHQRIEFDQPTIVEFEIREAQVAQSTTFGIVNLETDERIPVVRDAKTGDLAEFQFAANTPYTVYIATPQGERIPLQVSADSPPIDPNRPFSSFVYFGGFESLRDGTGVRIEWQQARNATATTLDSLVIVAGGFEGCPCKQYQPPLP